MKLAPSVAAALLAVTTFGVGADAHLKIPTVKGERQIELRLSEDPIRIGYRISLGATLASVERKVADRDGDQSVSALEGNARLDEHTDALLAALTICTGKTLASLECKKLERRDVESVEAEGWEPGPTGHLHFNWVLRTGRRASEIGAIRLDDAFEISGVEVSEAEIVPPRHAALELAGEAGRANGVAQRLTWIEERREPGPRSVIAVWPPPRTSPRRTIALVLAIAALVAAGGFWASRRRSR